MWTCEAVRSCMWWEWYPGEQSLSQRRCHAESLQRPAGRIFGSMSRVNEFEKKPWVITYAFLHFGADEHPCTTYFYVQGYRVLTHSHRSVRGIRNGMAPIQPVVSVKVPYSTQPADFESELERPSGRRERRSEMRVRWIEGSHMHSVGWFRKSVYSSSYYFCKDPLLSSAEGSFRDS